MNYTVRVIDSIAYVESEDVLITDSQTALDLVMTVIYDKNSTRIAIDKKSISEDFFRLSSGIAGEVLQKFINYRTKLAIIGDFSVYTSKPLHDFIYECNKGNDIYFVDSLDKAIEKLKLAS
jgi:hypothetical protein